MKFRVGLCFCSLCCAPLLVQGAVVTCSAGCADSSRAWVGSGNFWLSAAGMANWGSSEVSLLFPAMCISMCRWACIPRLFLKLLCGPSRSSERRQGAVSHQAGLKSGPWISWAVPGMAAVLLGDIYRSFWPKICLTSVIPLSFQRAFKSMYYCCCSLV